MKNRLIVRFTPGINPNDFELFATIDDAVQTVHRRFPSIHIEAIQGNINRCIKGEIAMAFDYIWIEMVSLDEITCYHIRQCLKRRQLVENIKEVKWEDLEMEKLEKIADMLSL